MMDHHLRYTAKYGTSTTFNRQSVWPTVQTIFFALAINLPGVSYGTGIGTDPGSKHASNLMGGKLNN